MLDFGWLWCIRVDSFLVKKKKINFLWMTLIMGKAMNIWGQEVYKKSLWLPLNFAVNLKLFWKNKIFVKGSNEWTPDSRTVQVINFQHTPEQGIKVANTAAGKCLLWHPQVYKGQCTHTCVCTDGPMGGRVVYTIKLLLQAPLISLVHT